MGADGRAPALFSERPRPRDGERSGRALLLTAHPPGARGVRSTLHSVVPEVTCATAAEALHRTAEMDLVVVTQDFLQHAEPHTLVTLVRPDKLIVLVDESERASAGPLLQSGVRHVLAGGDKGPLADLRIAARKMLSADIFGAEKYLGWGGEQWHMPLEHSDDKATALDLTRRIADAFQVGVRRTEQLEIIVEELVTNALYNAPVDAAQRRPHAGKSRAQSVALSPAERAQLTIATDGVRLAVGVRDVFGSLSPQTALSYLAKSSGPERGQVEHKPGGAGLGLYYCYEAVSHLVINIAQAAATEVVGLLDLHGPPGQVDRQAHSLGVFVR